MANLTVIPQSATLGVLSRGAKATVALTTIATPWAGTETIAVPGMDAVTVTAMGGASAVAAYVTANSSCDCTISGTTIVITAKTEGDTLNGKAVSGTLLSAGGVLAGGVSSYSGTKPTEADLMSGASSLIAFGDSITKGRYAVSTTLADWQTKGYAALLAARLGLPLTNYGWDGARVPDIASLVFPLTPAEGNVYTMLAGVNDQQADEGVAGLKIMREGLASMLVYLSTLQRTAYDDAGIAYSGSGVWTDQELAGIGYVKQSSTGSSTATFTVYGSAVYVSTVNQASAGTYSITIDGQLRGTVDNTVTVSTGNGAVRSPSLAVVRGLSHGPHEVVLTVVSGTVAFHFAATNAQPYSRDAQKVFVGTILRNTKADNDNPAYNNAIVDVVNGLKGDGLNLWLVDVYAYIDPATQTDDGLHPNESGHVSLADAFERVAANTGAAQPAIIRPSRRKVIYRASGTSTAIVIGQSTIGKALSSSMRYVLRLTWYDNNAAEIIYLHPDSSSSNLYCWWKSSTQESNAPDFYVGRSDVEQNPHTAKITIEPREGDISMIWVTGTCCGAGNPLYMVTGYTSTDFTSLQLVLAAETARPWRLTVTEEEDT